MKLKEDLVKQYHNGEIGIEHDRKSLELLKRLWIGDWKIEGDANYYTQNDAYAEGDQPQGVYIPIKQFLEGTTTSVMK